MAQIRVSKGLGGDFSAFWHEPIYKAPWELVAALSQSLTVLSWFENLPKDEQPPRWIWWSEKLLDEWFEDVIKKRNKGTSRTSSYDRADDVPMEQNELAQRPVFVNG